MKTKLRTKPFVLCDSIWNTMEWFSGGVANAIAASRQNKSLFLVYVYDASTPSTSTDEAWDSHEVKSVLSSHKFVAMKLLKDSLEFRQFSQFFPVFLFPSVFCIGMNGQVLISMSGRQTDTQLSEKLTEGFEKFQAELSPPPAQATPPQESPSLATPSAPPITVSSPRLEEVDSEASVASQGPNLDEKVQRAKELIKQRREEKEEQLAEKEKTREVERREMGKETAKFKKVQEDRQTQNWIKERQKQKDDAKKAREEIKAKLEQDKLERQSRNAASQRERSSAGPAVSSVMSSISTSGSCRIQLKLPEGGTSVVEMDRTDTLAMLRVRVAEELNASIGNVVLTSMYPRKELTSESDEQTMIQLQLVPSGVIIVRLQKGFVSSLRDEGAGNGVWGALTYVFQLIVWFLTFIKNAIAGLFGGGDAQGGKDEDSSQHQPDIRRERLSALGVGRGRERLDDGEGPRLRKFRQEDYQDESDEERKQTYNGNSTQQQ